MVTFNNALEIAVQKVCAWEKRNILSKVTLIRDVYGRISLLMDNREAVSEEQEEELKSLISQDMDGYFSGRVYWKKLPNRLKHAEQRRKPIVELIETEHQEWKEADGILFYIAERPIAKKAWIYRARPHESVWTYEEAVSENGTKVVSFYSFKGGMGRTTALAGSALTLAKRGKNIVMVDTDIEAPGLASLFFEEEAIRRGVLDYLIEHEVTSQLRIEDYVMDVEDPALLDEEDGHLYLMPAGKVDAQYLQKLARVDYQDNKENHMRDSMAILLRDIRDSYHPDYIFIDARAGFHDLGGVMVTQLPHGVVLFGNDSRQSWDGITQVLRTIAQGHTEDFPVMLVDAMCPKQTSPDFAAAREHFIQKAYTVCIESYYDVDAGVPGIEATMETHYPQMVPFDDALLRGIVLYSDGSMEGNRKVSAYKDILAGNVYAQLADRIEGWFGD